jgi:hypothetical protein
MAGRVSRLQFVCLIICWGLRGQSGLNMASCTAAWLDYGDCHGSSCASSTCHLFPRLCIVKAGKLRLEFSNVLSQWLLWGPESWIIGPWCFRILSSYLLLLPPHLALGSKPAAAPNKISWVSHVLLFPDVDNPPFSWEFYFQSCWMYLFFPVLPAFVSCVIKTFHVKFTPDPTKYN